MSIARVTEGRLESTQATLESGLTVSVIKDTRKLSQDFLAAELRELSARVNALEDRMEARLIRELRERITRIEAREKTN